MPQDDYFYEFLQLDGFLVINKTQWAWIKCPTLLTILEKERNHQIHSHLQCNNDRVGSDCEIFLSSWAYGAERDGKETLPSSLLLEYSSGNVNLQEVSKIMGTSKQ